jgi:hypothetical protein
VYVGWRNACSGGGRLTSVSTYNSSVEVSEHKHTHIHVRSLTYRRSTYAPVLTSLSHPLTILLISPSFLSISICFSLFIHIYIYIYIYIYFGIYMIHVRRRHTTLRGRGETKEVVEYKQQWHHG